MSRHLIRQAVSLFRTDLAPRSTRRHNARQWLRAVHQLGPRWVLLGGHAKWGNNTERSQ